ncbi:hypothetical protein [Synechocystis sp. LKSZ1]|uniref:calcium-binding protein n=1 Tax=Synechocystis sp. LKSZ1 TaxID=3144951 RepID=UPI00336C2762
MFGKFKSESYSINQSDIAGDGFSIQGTGSIALVDGSGFKWFANTNITFATTSSASAAVSEASFTHAVNATTVNGGNVATTLNDGFDGYNSLLVNGTPNTEANYNQLGSSPTTEDNGRELVFPVKVLGDIQVSRKLYVPTDDSFARWLNIVTNTGTTTQTVTLDIQNNLGSDSNTQIVSSSDGDTVGELSDTWVTTFQNYSGTTSSDPRLGHVLQGPNAPTPLARISFVNGDDNPTWGYTLTLAPGETQIIMNFATGQPSKAEAAAKAEELANLSPNAIEGLSAQELSQIVNFQVNPVTVTTPNRDSINTGPGNDFVTTTLDNLRQRDSINGGAGNDTLVLNGPGDSTPLKINLSNASQVLVQPNFIGLPIPFLFFPVPWSQSSVKGFENVDASGFTGNLNLTGSNLSQTLKGGSGADRIFGLGGDDLIDGGLGADELTGGLGNDMVYLGNDSARDKVYYSAGDGMDTVFQFNRANDQIIFSGIANINVQTVGSNTEFRNQANSQLLMTLTGTTGFTSGDVGASKALTGGIFSFL